MSAIYYAAPKLPVIISEAATHQMRELRVPPYRVREIARKANDRGDGLYRTPEDYLVTVQDKVIVDIQ